MSTTAWCDLRNIVRFAVILPMCTTLISAAAVAQTQTVSLAFDEIPFQSVDGLMHAGVTFGFAIDGASSPEAFYNSFGPGQLTLVMDPSLTGDASGALRLDFATPTTSLAFDVALNTASSLSPAFHVELFDANLNSSNVTSVDADLVSGVTGFTEGRFVYSGAPVSRAMVTFEHKPGSFALDNLSFILVPEPSCLVLSTSALAFLLIIGRRRRGARARGR